MHLADENSDFFRVILEALDRGGALRNLTLVGSWCLVLYQYHFESKEIPVYRTLDVDFLVSRPVNIVDKVSVPAILRELGFDLLGNSFGQTKFVHPKLDVDFVIPELGAGQTKSIEVAQFGIDAVPLRYLQMLQDSTMRIPFGSTVVRLPEPAAFVLHKYILSTVRIKKPEKSAKDLLTAQELSRFLLGRD